MTFQQLIMCVDNSGSMSGSKIKNATDALNSIASSLGCNTKYFRFGCKVEQISSFDDSTLPCDDGTRIADCLADLYNNQLKRFCGSATKFIFVTDAEDSIPDVSTVLSIKRGCESAYGSKLSSYCLLVGSGGGCSNELKQIFGNAAFDHVNSDKFKSELQNMSKSFQAVGKLQNASSNIDAEIESLTKSTNEEIREFGEKCNKLLKNVKKSETETADAANKIHETRRNLDKLDHQKQNLSRQVHSQLSEDQAGRLKVQIGSTIDGYHAERHRLSYASQSLDSAQQILKTETGEADAVANKLKANTSNFRTTANKVISNIVQSMKDLENMHKSCTDQVTALKKRFRKDMANLLDIVQQNDHLCKEIRQVQNNISGAFKDLKRNKIELQQLQTAVRQNISELDGLLEHMDNQYKN